MSDANEMVQGMLRQFEERLLDQVGQVTQLESAVCDLGHRIEQGLATCRLKQIESTRLQIEAQEGRTRDQIDNIRLHTESSVGDLQRKMDEMSLTFLSGVKTLTDTFASKPVAASQAPAPPVSAPTDSFASPTTVPITPAPPSRSYFPPPSRASDVSMYAPRWSMPLCGANIPSPFSQPSHAPSIGTYKHPADPMTVDGEERRQVNAVRAELTTADPDTVALLYQESPVHEIALLCLKGGLSGSGNVWPRRVFHSKILMLTWCLNRLNDSRCANYQQIRFGELVKLPFPVALKSIVPNEAAAAWERYRLTFIKTIGGCLNFGCGNQDIFSPLLVAASNDTNGNPKVKAFLEDLIDDHNICRNPLPACDVLLRQCDQSFSNGATGYSPESPSIKWDHMKARPEGIDSMQLAQMVTRAYLQMQGDLTGVTMSNVNNLPAAHQETAERYDVCLFNDSNKARGEEYSMKFKEYVALANVLVAHV
jgi:hypothetical protein